MDIQNARDRLLEVENLTDNLEDEDADWLINWGIDHLEPLIGSVEDDLQAGDKLNQLLQVMRDLNRIAGDPSAASSEEVRAFLDDYANTFGVDQPADQQDPSAAERVGADIAALSPRDALMYLLGLVEPSPVDAADGAGPMPADAINEPTAPDAMGQGAPEPASLVSAQPETPSDPDGGASIWSADVAESGAGLISTDAPAEQYGPPDPGVEVTPDKPVSAATPDESTTSTDKPAKTKSGRRRKGRHVSDANDL